MHVNSSWTTIYTIPAIHETILITLKFEFRKPPYYGMWWYFMATISSQYKIDKVNIFHYAKFT